VIVDDQEENHAAAAEAELDEIRAEDREMQAQIDADRQAELDAEAARRRAKEREELAAQEAANYARHHAIIERDEEGNPIEKTEQE
jgi:hypothetical protein